MLVKACKAGFCKQLVVAGQKSGLLWALNPDTGEVTGQQAQQSSSLLLPDCTCHQPSMQGAASHPAMLAPPLAT